MEKRCLRCNSLFLQKTKRSNYNTFTCIEAEHKQYIREIYKDCVCDKCKVEINKDYYSFGINPKFLNQKE